MCLSLFRSPLLRVGEGHRGLEGCAMVARENKKSNDEIYRHMPK